MKVCGSRYQSIGRDARVGRICNHIVAGSPSVVEWMRCVCFDQDVDMTGIGYQLVFASKQIGPNESTLEECGIQENSTVFVIWWFVASPLSKHLKMMSNKPQRRYSCEISRSAVRLDISESAHPSHQTDISVPRPRSSFIDLFNSAVLVSRVHNIQYTHRVSGQTTATIE